MTLFWGPCDRECNQIRRDGEHNIPWLEGLGMEEKEAERKSKGLGQKRRGIDPSLISYRNPTEESTLKK